MSAPAPERRDEAAFLSTLGHELRAPLNEVIGFSRLLQQSPILGAAEKRQLDAIQRSGTRLFTLVGDLLELTRIERGCTSPAEVGVALPALLDGLLELARRRAELAGVKLAVDLADGASLPAGVCGDGDRLMLVLDKLLVQAIDCTPAGREVSLQVRCQVSGGTSGSAAGGAVRLACAVGDRGPVWWADDPAGVFVPFAGLGALAGRPAGSGLELALAHATLRLLGSELTVERRPGGGSLFAFGLELPLAAEPVPAAAAAPAPARGRRVLLADDTPEGRLLLRSLLEPFDLEITEVGSGSEAIAAWRRERPALILMDWRMPELDGIEATRRIRTEVLAESAESAASAAPGVPRIVLISAAADELIRTRALAAGADDFLVRPFDEAALYALLNRQLGVLPPAPAPSGSAAPPLLSGRALASLPPAVLDALYDAVRELNGAKVVAVLSRIGPEHAEYAELAAALGVLCEDFRFQELWTLIDEARALQRRPADPVGAALG